MSSSSFRSIFVLIVFTIVTFGLTLVSAQDNPPDAPAGFAVTADPGTLPSSFAWFYKPPADGNLDLLIQNFDSFILTKTDEVSRDYLILNGARQPILQYLLSNEIQDPGSCTAQPFRNQVADRIGDFCWISQQHPDWFLVDSNGIRLSKAEGTKTTYYMDPGNAEWRQFWISRVKETQETLGWNGVFLDNIDASLRRLLRTGRAPVKYPDDVSYQAAIEEYLRDISESYFAFEQRPLYANITEVLGPAAWFRYLVHLNGAMNESFAAYWDPQYYTVAQWEEHLSRAEQSLSQGKALLLIGHGSQSDVVRQQFLYGSYLLVTAPGASFRYTKSEFHRYAWLYDNFDLDLGQPLGSRYQTGGRWRRDFTRGYVLVDPSAHTAEIIRTTDKQVFLSWADSSTDEEAFEVERSTDGQTFELIATLPANQTIYADSGLEAGVEYFYRVRAINNDGGSAYSQVLSIRAAWIGPVPPTDLNGTVASTSRIDLNWSDNSDNESGFEIEQSTDGAGFTKIAALYPDTSLFSVNGLQDATTYYYRVRAFNADGYSPYTNIVQLDTPLAAPSAPNNLQSLAVSATRIDLSWSDQSHNEDGFYLESSLDGVNFLPLATIQAGVLSYSHIGLSPTTTYFYRLRAFNAAGQSVDVTTTATTFDLIPAAPAALTAAARSATEIQLNWTDVAVNETGYKLERSTNGTTFSQIAILAAGATSYSNTGLAASTTYYYRIRAYNVAGSSAYSNTASARTLSSLPAAPSNAEASGIARNKIKVTWKDNALNETGFKIERSTDGKSFSQIATVGANVVTYTSSSLSANRVYYYRIRAYNSYGDSAYSNIASGRTYR